MNPSLTGRTFGRYRLLERIGVGALGEVYRAHDDRLDRDVAVKVSHSGTLNHPNIAKSCDFDGDAGVDFVVMELVAGETLSSRVHAGPTSRYQSAAEMGAAMQTLQPAAAPTRFPAMWSVTTTKPQRPAVVRWTAALVLIVLLGGVLAALARAGW